eukprot:GDKK01017011.1.p1 GENE.GDKK01017011.1~~GDKK01017011.1.p1  ORF type:complete len:342 (+),score=34.96 GDKK01017011.1:262-1287(+)
MVKTYTEMFLIENKLLSSCQKFKKRSRCLRSEDGVISELNIRFFANLLLLGDKKNEKWDSKFFNFISFKSASNNIFCFDVEKIMECLFELLQISPKTAINELAFSSGSVCFSSFAKIVKNLMKMSRFSPFFAVFSVFCVDLGGKIGTFGDLELPKLFPDTYGASVGSQMRVESKRTGSKVFFVNFCNHIALFFVVDDVLYCTVPLFLNEIKKCSSKKGERMQEKVQRLVEDEIDNRERERDQFRGEMAALRVSGAKHVLFGGRECVYLNVPYASGSEYCAYQALFECIALLFSFGDNVSDLLGRFQQGLQNVLTSDVILQVVDAFSERKGCLRVKRYLKEC